MLTKEQLGRQKIARQQLIEMGHVEIKLTGLVKDYAEYQSLFKDDLVVAVRKVLKRLEDKGDYGFQDSREHGLLVEYFNKFALHKKIDKKEFEKWSHFQELKS